MFQPSKYQEAIYNFIANGSGHGIVKAVAGSGKTTTLVESLKLTVGKVLFLAFNKSIAETLKKRSPSNVECSTLHAAGYALLRSYTSKIKVDSYKIDNIMDGYVPLQRYPSMRGKEAQQIYTDRNIVKKMVSYIKAGLIDYTNEKELQTIADYYGLDDYEPKHIPMIKYVIEKNNSVTSFIDFDDMIYLPIILKLKAKTVYDFIFVDESQDLNRAQIELVLSLITSTGRVICVGDPKQSIYGFRGADCGAIERIKLALNAKEFPLSVCYRCPQVIIDLAKKIVPEIEARDNAPQGEIVSIKDQNFIEKLITENDKETLILSRTNAELVSYALKLISQGYKAVIKGRDIGQGLINLVKKQNANSIQELQSSLTNWHYNELDKLSKRFNADAAINLVNDKYDTLMLILQNCNTVYCVINKLETLFNDDNTQGYIFSSIHRAKGLEAQTVYILAPHKLPLTWKNQQAWELEQEMNIRYVAITRSLNKLVWVNQK